VDVYSKSRVQASEGRKSGRSRGGIGVTAPRSDITNLPHARTHAREGGRASEAGKVDVEEEMNV